MPQQYNDKKAFHDLKLEELQNRAKDWVDDFQAIQFEKILLYHHDQRIPQYFNRRSPYLHHWRSLKYVLIFLVSNYQNIKLSEISDYPLKTVEYRKNYILKKNVQLEGNLELWEWIKSLKEILYPDQFVNSPIDIHKHHLFHSDFYSEVYKSQIDEKFYKKWRIIIKRPNEKFDKDFVREDKPFWVLYSKDSEKNSRKIPIKGCEDFIKNLKIYFENDYEVAIKVPGRSTKIITSDSLGFRNNKTKEWKTFLEILQEPPHIYQLGKVYKKEHRVRKRMNSEEHEFRKNNTIDSNYRPRNKEYDNRLKLLRNINNKLIKYLNEHYRLDCPNKFKIYEKCENEKSGTYRFKFQVLLNDIIKTRSELNLERLNETNLIDKIKKLQNKTYKNRYDEQEIEEALRIGFEKYGWNDDYIQKLTNGDL